MDDQNMSENKKKNPSPLIYNKHENKCYYEGVTTEDKENQDKKCDVSVIYVDGDGYIQNAGIIKNAIHELDYSIIDVINAIVLHRTAGSTAKGAMSSFQKTGIGSQFVIDKNGFIYQTAGMSVFTQHVGPIRSRNEIEKTASPEEMKRIKKFGLNYKALHEYEKTKNYPNRFPHSGDSVGIEVVAKCIDENKDIWEKPTIEQSVSINKLVDIIMNIYELTTMDIYEHDKISRKTEGEGAGLYTAQEYENSDKNLIKKKTNQ